MRWIEIITIRSPNNIYDSLVYELLKPAAKSDEGNNLISMKIYRNAWFNTDLSIHLHWKSTRNEQGGSAVGLRLAQTLKEFGLVNHSAWVEEREQS